MRFIGLMLLVCSCSLQAHSFDLESSSTSASESTSSQLSVHSSTQQEDCSPDCTEVGEWRFGIAFGAGHLSSPIAGEDDTWLPLIPRFSYYGESFFVDNFTVGYNLVETASYSFDLIAEPNLDFLHFDTASDLQKAFVTVSISPMDGDPNNTEDLTLEVGDYDLSDRKVSYLAGPSFRFGGEIFSVSANYKKEVLGESNGREAEVEFSYQKIGENWRFRAAVGAVWKSQEVVDYYYGISESETPAFFEHLAFTATESALNPFVNLELQVQYSHAYTFIISLKRELLDKSVTQSPIVDTDTVNSFFIGVGYEFD